jgi:hypothetical protein
MMLASYLFVLIKSVSAWIFRIGKESEMVPESIRDFSLLIDYLKKEKWLKHKKRRTVQKLLPRKE